MTITRLAVRFDRLCMALLYRLYRLYLLYLYVEWRVRNSTTAKLKYERSVRWTKLRERNGRRGVTSYW